MKISVSAKHGQLADDIQQAIEHKVSKLPRFFDRTTGVDVIVNLKAPDHPSVELVLSAEETHDFVATADGSNVLAALDAAVQKVEQQLRKHKDKLTDRRGRVNRAQADQDRIGRDHAI